MNEDNLDLLDLDDGTSIDTLPDAPAFAAPRPRRPWLLLGLGVIVIVLSTFIIIRMIASDDSSSMDVDLDAPVVVVDDMTPPPAAVHPEPIMPVPVQENPAPSHPAQTLPLPADARPVMPVPDVAPSTGAPVRVIEDRKEVTFNPDRVEAKPAAQKPAAKPAAKPAVKPAPKPAPKKPTVAPQNGSWFVQFGSYSTRALAQSGEAQLRKAHPTLLEGKQFTILASQLKDGTTKYRLRIAFATAADANGFCKNAKSDGLDCYVTK